MSDTTAATQLAALFDRMRAIGSAPVFAELMQLNLGLSHLKALRIIEERAAGLPMKHLANALSMTPPSVTTLVRRLEQVGLVERVRHESDSRVWLLRLTTDGQRITSDMRQQHVARMQALLDVLSLADQQNLISLLERAVRAAEQLQNAKN